jgi:hypothetical protein
MGQGAGATWETVAALFERYFLQGMSEKEFRANRYVYSIRHLYALEGSRIDHLPDTYAATLPPLALSCRDAWRCRALMCLCLCLCVRVAPHRCAALVQQTCQPNDCNGCPYATHGAPALRAALARRHGPADVDTVCDLAASGHYQVRLRAALVRPPARLPAWRMG